MCRRLDNHCFETLNGEVGVVLFHYRAEYFHCYFEVSNEMALGSLVDVYGGQLPVSDFVDFINEVRA